MRPLRTISAAISQADRGDTVVVGSGRYHESLKIEARPGLTLTAAPGARVWLDGSRVVEGWAAREGGMWGAHWDVHFDHSPTFVWGAPDHQQPGWQFLNPKYPMAAHPDQVWIDDAPQIQVGSRSEVEAGAFFFDEAGDRLLLGTDPRGRTVRASALDKAISIRSTDVTVRGINVVRFAPSVPHMGAVTVTGRGARLEDLAISDNATTGLHVAETDARITDVTTNRNGMAGITATAAHRLMLEDVQVRQNNVERFNPSPTAGGIKIGRTQRVVVRNSVLDGNHGTGLWLDESSYDIGVFHTRMSRNFRHGLSIEVSGRADVVGNLIVDNRGNGMKINDTEDVQIWNNTLVGNDREINVVQDHRDTDAAGSYRDYSLPLTWQIRHVSVRNNVMSATTGDTLLAVEDFSGRFSATELDVTALGNLYHRPGPGQPSWIVVWSRGTGDPYAFKNLARFRLTSLQEMPGELITGRPILGSGHDLQRRVRKATIRIAQPLPEALAERARRPRDERRLGAWITWGP